jgi:hypothetical protein
MDKLKRIERKYQDVFPLLNMIIQAKATSLFDKLKCLCPSSEGVIISLALLAC